MPEKSKSKQTVAIKTKGISPVWETMSRGHLCTNTSKDSTRTPDKKDTLTARRINKRIGDQNTLGRLKHSMNARCHQMFFFQACVLLTNSFHVLKAWPTASAGGGGGIGAQPTNSSAGGRVKTSGFGKKEMLRTSSWTPHFVTDLLPIVTSSFALVTSSDALATEGNVEPSHPRFKRGSCVAVRCNTGRSGGGSVRRAPKPRRSKGPT